MIADSRWTGLQLSAASERTPACSRQPTPGVQEAIVAMPPLKGRRDVVFTCHGQALTAWRLAREHDHRSVSLNCE